MLEPKVYSDFLALVRAGIGHVVFEPLSVIDWPAVRTLSEQQGLSAIVLDGIEQLPVELRPPQELLLEWIGEVLQTYEYTYNSYCSTIAEIASFFNSHGLKMMILKGYACSLDWPNPNHRPCGDIDIWQFGEYKKADALLQSEKGIKVDKSHHHHTVYYWGDYMVENHYDFINVHHHKSNAEFEKILKSLAQNDDYYVELRGERVYLPSPNLHALFLLRHAMMEFAATGLNLRQLLDWAFFVEKHGDEVDEKWLYGLIEKHHMATFFNIINAICVEELGFQSNIFPSVQYVPYIKDRVLKEILEPEFDWQKAHDKNVIKRILFKYRRWKGGAWKRKLCFGEGPIESFAWSVRSHLLKPASI